MDPVGTIDDEKIWNVLQIAQLNELIMGLPDKLGNLVMILNNFIYELFTGISMIESHTSIYCVF